jgi:hypothetical protein
MTLEMHPSLILFQSMIANVFYNMDSQRFRKAPLDSRSEGWTEAWGGKEQQQQQQLQEQEQDRKDQLATKNHSIKDLSPTLIFEDTTNSIWVEVDDPSIHVLLTQYRPAWFEQLILKIAKIPYIVVNSTYHCNEATGPLPFLREYQGNSEQPVLIGRHHPSNLIHNNDDDISVTATTVHENSILTYLQKHRNVDVDGQANLTEIQKALSHCFLQMIQNELQQILLFLRYEDFDAWEQIYRQQYIQASCPSSYRTEGSINWFLQLRGRFQGMMERSVERRRLMDFTSRTVNIQEGVEMAREAYQALERQLIAVNAHSTSGQQRKYLLGTDRPSLSDAALWAHLADAMSDVHLVVVLASFPNLIQYFQDMYQIYFAIQSRKKSAKNGPCWEAWNERQNLNNAFQKIPLLSKNQLAKHGAIKDAIELMQSLSLQKQELNEVLAVVKAKRDEEPWPKPRRPTDSLLYRWAMGEDVNKSTTKPEKEENALRKKLMRDQVRNDQKWISGVAAASVVAILLLQAGASPVSQ